MQFDTQASDGVITGLSYEQSMRSYLEEGANKTDIHLTQTASAGSNTILSGTGSQQHHLHVFTVGFSVRCKDLTPPSKAAQAVAGLRTL